MEQNAAKFFGATDQDMAQYREEQEANRPVDQKTLIKQQFVMSKSGAQPGKQFEKETVTILTFLIFILFICSQ